MYIDTTRVGKNFLTCMCISMFQVKSRNSDQYQCQVKKFGSICMCIWLSTQGLRPRTPTPSAGPDFSDATSSHKAGYPSIIPPIEKTCAVSPSTHATAHSPKQNASSPFLPFRSGMGRPLQGGESGTSLGGREACRIYPVFYRMGTEDGADTTSLEENARR